MGALVDTSAVRVNDSPTSAEVPAFTTRDEEERGDALSPMHGQLDIVKAWWMLEWLPLRHRRQYEGFGLPRHYWSYVPYHNTSQSAAGDHPNKPISPRSNRVNLGRPRELLRPTRDGEKICVHRSVKIRMDLGFEVEGGKYNPKARFDHRDVEWVG